MTGRGKGVQEVNLEQRQRVSDFKIKQERQGINMKCANSKQKLDRHDSTPPLRAGS